VCRPSKIYTISPTKNNQTIILNKTITTNNGIGSARFSLAIVDEPSRVPALPATAWKILLAWFLDPSGHTTDPQAVCSGSPSPRTEPMPEPRLLVSLEQAYGREMQCSLCMELARTEI